MDSELILFYEAIHLENLAQVGGKNASLGEMISQLAPQGIRVPDGFATTAAAYRLFLQHNQLEKPIQQLLNSLDTKGFENLNEVSSQIRRLVAAAELPEILKNAIREAYATLCRKHQQDIDVAVRSSATAEDLPNASFAGLHDSFLHIRGAEAIIQTVQNCYASLFNGRAIKYRHDHGFDHLKTALSAGVQLMVRSDLACSGVCFTLEPESGFRDAIVITGSWGLGENIVQGIVNPDEFCLFKPTLQTGKYAILNRKMGSKAKMLVYSGAASSKTANINTPLEKQNQWILSDEELHQLGKWCQQIENHYQLPMDIEWAKDGNNGQLYIIQARPETVHSRKDPFQTLHFKLLEEGPLLVQGNAIGKGITSGRARVLESPAEAHKLQAGEVLVTDNTNPDWDPILKKAAAIVTNKGGRTSHAAIVARESGTVAVVGCLNATQHIRDEQMITVSCAQGKTGNIYEGALKWEETPVDLRQFSMPRTAPMLILGDPEKAFPYSFYPNQGIGLMRLEFVISHAIRIHPMALVNFEAVQAEEDRKSILQLTAGYADKTRYFVDKLAEGVATIAAAFYPKDVIVRMSDFKTNEYANLIGGKAFEPEEENPMLGFRGASRYYHDRYKEGFRLECEALKKVRDTMGLDNVKLMIPFCRTVEEGQKVIDLMATYGLKRGAAGLEIYVMAEIPSNVLLAKEFANLFDGFSIGSNDLTQLTLGLDRDSAIISNLFDENNPAVKMMIRQVIETANSCGAKIGLCGQAPSDFPEFTRFLIEAGIHSISFNPDALLKGIQNMLQAELES